MYSIKISLPFTLYPFNIFMLGFTLSLITAVLYALQGVFSKRLLKDFNEYLTSTALAICNLCIFLPMLALYPLPPLGENFFLALLVSGVLNILATVFYMKDLREE